MVMENDQTQATQIDSLYRLSRLIGTKEDPNDLLGAILSEIVESLNVSSASISLIDADTNELRIEASHGLGAEESNYNLRLGEGITGWVALQGKPLLAEDVSKETRYFPLKDSVRSEMAVPLKEQNEVIGVINVDSDELNAFSERDLKFLTLLAGEAGRVVSRVWFVSQLQTKARLLQGIINLSKKMISKLDTSAVIDNVTFEARHMLHCRIAAFLTYDEDRQTIQTHTIYGRRGKINYHEEISVHDSSIGVAIQRKKQIEVLSLVKTEQHHMMDIIVDRQLKSMLCTPIIYEDKILGTLNLYTDQHHRFNNDEKTAFQTIASLAAVAIQNAQLYERVFQSEDTLRKNERLTTLGLLAAEIAHEIRNPLTVIKLLFDSLEMDFPEDDIRKKDLSIIHEKLEHLEEIVSKVLDFGKSKNTLKAPIEMNELIDDTLHLIRIKLKQQKIDIEFQPCLGKTEIYVNKGQIQQAILNLILNSAQAMQSGGTIRISTNITSFDTKDFIYTKVSDTGQGVPEGIKDKIFDSFLTSKKEGTGLGLSIVRRILKSHDGDIELLNTSETGTTFQLKIPLNKKMDFQY